LDYRIADAPETADFLLLGSSTAPEMSLRKDHAPLLDRAFARGLPLICANPDRIGVAASGFTEGPGALAAYYESLGGKVRYIGKPHGEVYARALHMLGDTPPGRILAVGDSLEHDIAGGIRARLTTVLIAGGIHAADLTDPSALAVLSTRYGATPDFVIPRLVW
jgi:HAD superfamily hydrolase (TIGR01459 family)